MNPAIDSDWMILYTIEGARQLFVNNTRMKIDSVTINGKKSAIATFTFNLPENTKPGAFRATYRTEGAAFVDFFFNKEDVSFVFNPDYPNETVTFSASRENKIYQEYLNKASPLQQSMVNQTPIWEFLVRNLPMEQGNFYENPSGVFPRFRRLYQSLWGFSNCRPVCLGSTTTYVFRKTKAERPTFWLVLLCFCENAFMISLLALMKISLCTVKTSTSLTAA